MQENQRHVHPEAPLSTLFVADMAAVLKAGPCFKGHGGHGLGAIGPSSQATYRAEVRRCLLEPRLRWAMLFSP